jgi:methylated-DNA-[protein]-cysteine S-methyltransferase
MAHAQLDAYFLQQRQVFSLPVDYSVGTAFQQAVWRQLTLIAPGQTTNYAAIALAIGNRAAVRAVGGAVGRNPLSIVVPCHRVIGSNGAMTGYAGGLPRKIALLQLESAI